VRDSFHQLSYRHLDAQLLKQFSAQTVLERLARMPLSAGKFPQPAQMRVGVTLGDEKFAVANDQASGDFD
jgi:hypothetical protein